MMQHPTIRAIAGAPETSRLDPSVTALLVIDFQEEYFSGRLPIPNGAAALENAKLLIEKADKAGMSVFHVQHITPSGSPIFAEGGKRSLFIAISLQRSTMQSSGNLRSVYSKAPISTSSSRPPVQRP